MITLQNIIEANYDRNIIVYKELETGQMCLVSDQEVLALQYDPKIKIVEQIKDNDSITVIIKD